MMKQKMMKIFTGALLILLALAFISCSDIAVIDKSPGDKTVVSTKGMVTIKLNTGSNRGAIFVTSNQVVSVTVTLTGPDGGIQSMNWIPGGTATHDFATAQSGTYTITETETDSSGAVASTTKSLDVLYGWNYSVTINIGGTVMVEVLGGTSNPTPAPTNSQNFDNYAPSSAPCLVHIDCGKDDTNYGYRFSGGDSGRMHPGSWSPANKDYTQAADVGGWGFDNYFSYDFPIQSQGNLKMYFLDSDNADRNFYVIINNQTNLIDHKLFTADYFPVGSWKQFEIDIPASLVLSGRLNIDFEHRGMTGYPPAISDVWIYGN